jgi:DNA-binding NarL/FixJ family response regulator
MNDVRVLVADDHPLFRQGIIHTIREQQGLSVVAEASTAAGAIEAARESRPDVLLLDLQFPDGNGLDVLAAVAVDCPSSRVIILTVVEDQEVLLQALKIGARGYVLKGIAGDDLISVIMAVAAGESYVTPQMAGRLLSELTDRARGHPAHPASDLTEREHEVLELVATGLTNKEIGDRLFLTEKTVKHYMTNILGKLQVRNRVEAAMLAREKRVL